MDPIATLAASAVAALTPYLAKAGEEFAKEAGKAAVAKFSALYQVLKDRFKNKPTAKEALVDLETNPNDEDAQAALRLQLKKQLTADPSFVEALQKLVNDIKEDKETFSFLTQVYGGKVGDIFNIGKVGTLNIK
jgi:hypothetical protein